MAVGRFKVLVYKITGWELWSQNMKRVFSLEKGREQLRIAAAEHDVLDANLCQATFAIDEVVERNKKLGITTPFGLGKDGQKRLL